MAVRRMARILLPSSWVNSSLLSYGCTPYGASIHAFSLGYLIFAIVWLYAVWREYYCLWPGLPHLCHRMAERYMARALLPLAWALLTCDCTPYGASILDFGLGYLIFAIKWLHILWREYHCLWLGLIHLWSHTAIRRMTRVLSPLAWVTSPLPSYGCTSYGVSIIVVGLG